MIKETNNYCCRGDKFLLKNLFEDWNSFAAGFAGILVLKQTNLRRFEKKELGLLKKVCIGRCVFWGCHIKVRFANAIGKTP